MENRPLIEKWLIMTYPIAKNGVVKLEYRLPFYVFHCTGIAITFSDFKGVYFPHTLGELSLSFNNRKSQPVCYPLKYSTERFRIDYLLCRMEEPLSGGTRINGYFKNIVPFDYTIKIYLQCLQYQ